MHMLEPDLRRFITLYDNDAATLNKEQGPRKIYFGMSRNAEIVDSYVNSAGEHPG